MSDTSVTKHVGNVPELTGKSSADALEGQALFALRRAATLAVKEDGSVDWKLYKSLLEIGSLEIGLVESEARARMAVAKANAPLKQVAAKVGDILDLT